MPSGKAYSPASIRARLVSAIEIDGNWRRMEESSHELASFIQRCSSRSAASMQTPAVVVVDPPPAVEATMLDGVMIGSNQNTCIFIIPSSLILPRLFAIKTCSQPDQPSLQGLPPYGRGVAPFRIDGQIARGTPKSVKQILHVLIFAIESKC